MIAEIIVKNKIQTAKQTSVIVPPTAGNIPIPIANPIDKIAVPFARSMPLSVLGKLELKP